MSTPPVPRPTPIVCHSCRRGRLKFHCEPAKSRNCPWVTCLDCMSTSSFVWNQAKNTWVTALIAGPGKQVA